MIEFDYNKIMKEKTVIHCKTEKEAINLLKWADSVGLKWCSDNSYLNKNYWYEYKKDTCYNLYDGEYTKIIYYEDEDYNILSYEEALKPLTKADYNGNFNIRFMEELI